ncbi:hypothetical protein DKX38_017810 [Salix brachista]|uniref:S-locus receptor kinase C-terminal domain-containing protein n=1 Tax=Salix brachista TaxID=2182728 RepID=A0A5N5KWA0_9ROSI|nr:hypothetical protein DKX38_017810 [Salix brachista]
MSSVVVMLGSENPLPQPKQPGFFMGKNPPEQGSSSSKHESYSANEVTLTSLEARRGCYALPELVVAAEGYGGAACMWEKPLMPREQPLVFVENCC